MGKTDLRVVDAVFGTEGEGGAEGAGECRELKERGCATEAVLG